jgi:hypothetical protein
MLVALCLHLCISAAHALDILAVGPLLGVLPGVRRHRGGISDHRLTMLWSTTNHLFTIDLHRGANSLSTILALVLLITFALAFPIVHVCLAMVGAKVPKLVPRTNFVTTVLACIA